MSTASVDESEVAESITIDDPFKEHQAILKPIYREWIESTKKPARQVRGKIQESLKNDAREFFYDFVPSKLPSDEDEAPTSLAMEFQAMGESKQINVYLMLGKDYKGKLDQQSKGIKRKHVAVETTGDETAASGFASDAGARAGAGGGEPTSSQGSDRNLRSQRRAVQ